MQNSESQPAWRKMAKAAARIALTLFIVAGCIAGVSLGRDMLAARAADAPAPDTAAMTSVRVAPLTLEPGYSVTRAFTGQIQPAQQTTLSFEIGGTVDRIHVDDGDRVTKDTVIATLDTRLRVAERAGLVAARQAAEAQAELARRTADRQSTLLDRGHVSAQRVDETSLTLAQLTARTLEIDAAISAIDIRLEKSVIRAPFDGRVTLRHLDDGSVAAGGTPVVTILQDSLPQFRVGVAPAVFEQISAAQDLHVIIDGMNFPVDLNAVLPRLDAATRTRTVLLDFRTQDLPAFGDTGDLILEQWLEVQGAWVPLSALRSGTRGLWDILTVAPVGDAHKVQTEAVEILFADQTRAFVRGTFRSGTQLIATGAHRVVPGQSVSTIRAAE